jgi:hypothetical protein
MSTMLINWLRGEFAWLGRAARAWPLYALLLGSLALWSAAWQVKPGFTLDIGGPEDDAFVSYAHTGALNGPSSFFAKEHNADTPPLTYRWSRDHSRIVIPGWGNSPANVTVRLAGARPTETGLPPPVVTLTVGSQVFPLPTMPDLQDYTVFVERGDPLADDLVLTLDSPTFQPPGDPRNLGVLVARVTVAPAGEGLRPWTLPPPGHLALWGAALALLYAALFRLLGTATGAALLAAGGSLLLAWGIAAARPAVGLLAAEAPVLLLWAYPLLILGIPLARRLRPTTSLIAHRWIAAAFTAGFVLRFGGMVYPQFLSSDLTFHMHNLVKIQLGIWSFSSALPNGIEVPYPPAAYLVLAPLAGLVPDLSLVLRWGVSLLDAATVFPLVYIVGRIAAQTPPHSALRAPYPAIGAAWAGALLPAAFFYFSEGTYSNLFAQATFAFTLAPWVAVLVGRGPGQAGRTRGVPAWLLLLAGFTLTFLGHYGMLIAALGIVGLSVLLPLILGPGVARRRAGWVLAALAGATVLAFVLYYVHWLPQMRAQVEGVLSGGSGRAGLDLGALVGRTGRRLSEQWGGALALGGAAGLGALLVGLRRGAARRLVVAWIGAALVAGAIFAALDQTVGDSIRYPLLLAPWIALGAGTFWGLLARRGAAGPLFVAVLGLTAAWHLLTTWVNLVLTHYH